MRLSTFVIAVVLINALVPSLAGILETNDLGIPRVEHIPVSDDEIHTYKRDFTRVHPEMGNTTYTYDAMLKSHVIVVTQDAGIMALECYKNSLEIYLAPGLPVPEFPVGSIIVGGPEYQCVDEDGDLTAAYHEITEKMGFFNSSGKVMLRFMTKEVTLMDLFHYAHVHVHHIPIHKKSDFLEDHELEDEFGSAGNASLHRARDKRFQFNAGLRFLIGDKKPVPLRSDDESGSALSCEKCFFELGVEFQFVLDFSYWWIFPNGVDRFKVLFAGDATLNIDIALTVEKKSNFPTKSYPLFSKDFNPITFFIGPVPVVIVPGLKIAAKFNYGIEAMAKLSFGFDVGVYARLGVEYTRARGFETIHDFGLPASFHKPTLEYSGRVFARAYLEPVLVAKIYGVFPITTSIEPYAEVSLSVGSSNPCKLDAQFKLEAGLGLTIGAEPLDFKLFKVSFGGVLPASYTLNLYGPHEIFSFCLLTSLGLLPAPQTAPIPRYITRIEPWSPCSAVCGPGTQTREVYCFDFNTQSRVAFSSCSNEPMPPTTKTCDLRDCRPCGFRSCETCFNEPNCLWCYDHGGRCDVSSAFSACKYNVTRKAACPVPVKTSAAISTFTAGKPARLLFTGGLNNEPFYPSFSYDSVKFYHGGIFPHHAFVPAFITLDLPGAKPQDTSVHVVLMQYDGCLPAGNISVGIFSLITEHTAFKSGIVGPPRAGAGCILYTPYNTCSRTCGPATQTRNYTCFNGGLEGCTDVQKAKVLANSLTTDPLEIPCQSNVPCFDKPMYVTKPAAVVLDVSHQHLLVSWIGGQDYEQVNIYYRFMKDFYVQAWHSWMPFPNNPFPNTGSTKISMATGFPPHTFYEVRVCSSVNTSNCDDSSIFSVTKPVQYSVSIGSSSTTTVSSRVMLTIRGVATNHSELSSTLSLTIPPGQLSTHTINGLDIGFIYTLELRFVAGSATFTPTIVTARSATQMVTFGVNLPLSASQPVIQRYSCEGNEQLACMTYLSAAGCGWCTTTSLCMGGTRQHGYNAQGVATCSGAQWHFNNQSFVLFGQAQTKRNANAARGLVTELLTTVEGLLNFTNLQLDSTTTTSTEYEPGDAAYISSSSVPTQHTTSTYDPSTTESAANTTNSYSSEEWESTSNDPADSTSTMLETTTAEDTTPTTSSGTPTNGTASSSVIYEETFTEENATTSGVSTNPTNQPSAPTTTPSATTTTTSAPTTRPSATTTKPSAATTRAPLLDIELSLKRSPVSAPTDGAPIINKPSAVASTRRTPTAKHTTEKAVKPATNESN